jgi:hypothetical protein
VSIDGQPRHSERMTEDDIRRFASYSGEPGERFHVSRDLTAMFSDQGARHSQQRLRLLAEETCRNDLLLECGLPGARERLGVGISRKECGSDHVHARIGRLRRENCRDEQLERVAIVKFGIGVRVLDCERLDYSSNCIGGLQWIGPPLDQPTFE